MWVQLGMNLREREREMEKVFGGAVLFFWLCCYTDNTKGREGVQLSTSFRFQQLSLGLHHAGRVRRELQEGDGVGRCFFLGSRVKCFFSILKPKLLAVSSGASGCDGMVQNNLFPRFLLYKKRKPFFWEGDCRFY